ncbi:MAG: sugar-transfer associated ATP-grasp domain-containing protein [Pseudomonadota bacterium]
MHLNSLLKKLRRRYPHGLFCFTWWIYLRCEKEKIHFEANRSLRGRCPKAIWFLIQLALSLRWKRFFAHQEIENALRIYGESINKKESIPINELRKTVQQLAFRFCIPPVDAIHFRLYRQPERALDFIFSTEVHGFHNLRNDFRVTNDHLVLQDKLRFSRRSIAAGLPCITKSILIRKGEQEDWARLLSWDSKSVFCKSRYGFGGVGAFGLWKRGDKVIGRKQDGSEIKSDEDAKVALQKLMSKVDVLVQPFIEGHPVLQSASCSGASVSLRVITQNSLGKPKVLASIIRVPRLAASKSTGMGHDFLVHVVAKIEQETGRIVKSPNSTISLHPRLHSIETSVFSVLRENSFVPFWKDIVNYSCAAQAEYNQLWAVAWDWIVTTDGPVLLEGNAIWGVTQPQETHDGLLSGIIDH